MNRSYKSDKEPIELLLGMGGPVQYLEHSLKDDLNYIVSVKTKAGTKQITIPIEAVQQIQSKKPTNQLIESIKKQLALESIGEEASRPTQLQTRTQSSAHLRKWLFSLFRIVNKR
ncbi:hypothetical protein GCM10027592_25820 [Spirosoma flavus]